MFYLGIDVSKKSHRFAVLNNEGERCAPPFSQPSNHEGFERLLGHLGKLGLSPANTLCRLGGYRQLLGEPLLLADSGRI